MRPSTAPDALVQNGSSSDALTRISTLLTGEVGWHCQRQAAASAARHPMGVTGVSDRITVEPKIASSAVRSDIEAAWGTRGVRSVVDKLTVIH
jgi:osmotically-inducible protein OsmY